MLRLSCHKSGREDLCVSAALLPVRPNHFEGFNGLNENITLRFMRSVKQCKLCGGFTILERAFADNLD